MATQSMLRGVVVILQKAGIYDVILPFILIFAILFAILERTKVLGTTDNDKKLPRKSLNTLVAFVISFLVVASAEIVRVINESLATISILFIVIVLFLMMVGMFVGDADWAKEYPKWTKFFMFASFAGIILIFINSLGWLTEIFGFLNTINISIGEDLFFSLIAIGVAGLIIYLIVKEGGDKNSKK